MALDPLEPYNRVHNAFRRSAEASASRFRSKMQRAAQKMRAASERGTAEMERARAQFEAEMERLQAKHKAELARLGATTPIPDVTKPADADDLAEAIAQTRRELQQVRARAPRGARGWRQIESVQNRLEELLNKTIKSPPKRKGRHRRRDDDDGGELAPVKPRPKPTPLMDGAEAPIE